MDHVQTAARSGGYHPLRDVPAAAWRLLLPLLQPFELAGLERALREAGRYDIAESAYRCLVARTTDIAYVRAYKGEGFGDWLGHAAEAEHRSAMFDLGMVRYKEGGVREADQWYRRAAELGHIAAMNNLGVLRALAGEVREAEQWYWRAANLGHPDAMNNLAICLYEDSRDEDARRWWSRAAEAGEAAAVFNLRLLQDQCHLAKVDLFLAACRSVVFWLVAGMIAAYGRQWRSGCGRSADGLGVCRRAGHVRAAGCGR